jgi:hypothetical protein
MKFGMVVEMYFCRIPLKLQMFRIQYRWKISVRREILLAMVYFHPTIFLHPSSFLALPCYQKRQFCDIHLTFKLMCFSYVSIDMKLEDVDYDESFLECLEILQNASKNWPGIMEDCV